MGRLAAAGAAALALRLAVVALWPPCYGGDALGRLENMDRPVWSEHQLPLTTVVVFLVGRVSRDPLAQRLGFAALSAAACVACGWAAGRALGPRTGLLVAAIAATAPVGVEYGTVPYGEPLFLGTLFPGLALWYAGRRPAAWLAGCLLLAVSTSARYEAWWALGVVVLLPPRPARGAWQLLLHVAFLFVYAWLGWGPPSPASSLRPGLGPDRLLAVAVTLGGTALLMTPPLFAAALAGMVHLRAPILGRRPPDASPDEGASRFLRALAALLVLDLALVAILEPFTPPDNPRQTVLPAAILSVLAAHAVQSWLAHPRMARLVPPLPASAVTAGVLVLLLAWPTALAVKRTRRQATAVEARAGHALGRWLEAHLAPGHHALVDAALRTDYPWLLPTAHRWTVVNAPGAASRIHAAGAVAPGSRRPIAYVAAIPRDRPVRAELVPGHRLAPRPSPDPDVALYEALADSASTNAWAPSTLHARGTRR